MSNADRSQTWADLKTILVAVILAQAVSVGCWLWSTRLMVREFAGLQEVVVALNKLVVTAVDVRGKIAAPEGGSRRGERWPRERLARARRHRASPIGASP